MEAFQLCEYHKQDMASAAEKSGGHSCGTLLDDIKGNAMKEWTSVINNEKKENVALKVLHQTENFHTIELTKTQIIDINCLVGKDIEVAFMTNVLVLRLIQAGFVAYESGLQTSLGVWEVRLDF